MSTAPAARAVRRGAAQRLAALAEEALGGPLPLRVRAWDGSEAGPPDTPSSWCARDAPCGGCSGSPANSASRRPTSPANSTSTATSPWRCA